MYQVDFLCIFLIKTLISGSDSFDSNTNTLTTATIRQSTSPKPTTFHRRINVETDESTTSDVLRLADARRIKRKKQQTSFWAWDSWCQLQPKEGKCEKQIIRFYYNLQFDQCSTFVYSGCDGNKNNFEGLTECEKQCKGSNFMNLIGGSTQPNYCYLQPDSGLCLAMIEKYYYDINENTCKKFTYGGCGGNENKFDTMFSCMRSCNVVQD